MAAQTATAARSTAAARYDGDAWRTDAACRDVEPEWFFPVGSGAAAIETADRARAICALCSVQDYCLGFALATNQQFGIWGGFDEEERRQMRRRRRLALIDGNG